MCGFIGYAREKAQIYTEEQKQQFIKMNDLISHFVIKNNTLIWR
jgi:asparagine synthetase B (glutamine-hydrolysing)